VIAAPADVRNQEELNSVRSKAVQAFGRIDVWVNCAAVLSFGRFEDISPEIFRRVIETNVLGYGNGARAALAQFSTQGDCGTLINVSSMLAVVGEPYVSAYVATKFAIRGLTACLRQETENRPNIHVCAVLPAAVDTPIYQKAGNVFGRKARSIFPVYSPERVADAIVSAADRPRREVMVGGFAYVLKIVEKIAPMLLERLIARLAPRLQFQQEPQPASDGNIFVAAEPEAMKGRWKSYWMTRLRR
jgi:short-subunit dehydrogenase